MTINISGDRFHCLETTWRLFVIAVAGTFWGDIRGIGLMMAHYRAIQALQSYSAT